MQLKIRNQTDLSNVRNECESRRTMRGKSYGILKIKIFKIFISVETIKPTSVPTTVVNSSPCKIRFPMVSLILLQFALLICSHVFRGYSTARGFWLANVIEIPTCNAAKYTWIAVTSAAVVLRLPQYTTVPLFLCNRI